MLWLQECQKPSAVLPGPCPWVGSATWPPPCPVNPDFQLKDAIPFLWAACLFLFSWECSEPFPHLPFHCCSGFIQFNTWGNCRWNVSESKLPAIDLTALFPLPSPNAPQTEGSSTLSVGAGRAQPLLPRLPQVQGRRTPHLGRVCVPKHCQPCYGANAVGKAKLFLSMGNPLTLEHRK